MVRELPCCAALGEVDLVTISRFANLIIGGLNALAGFRCVGSRIARSAPQRQSQGMCLAKAARMVGRLSQGPEPPPSSQSWAQLIDDKEALGISTAPAKLIAKDCDLIDPSGAVDALDAGGAEARDILLTSDFFQTCVKGLRHGGSIAIGNQAEYARLVVRQLRCHKVDLALSVEAWASVFPVAKSTGAQREVWNGANMSSAAATPPSPPHLATPTALVDLEALDGARIRVSKRDAECYFDRLSLPPRMRKWFGRPSLKLSDILTNTDMAEDKLENYMPHGARVTDNLVLWPVCTSWPMGFAWCCSLRNRSSSNVAKPQD